MPIDFGGLLATASRSIVQSQTALRAQIQWSRILDKPTEIKINRNGQFLAIGSQTVRIEQDDTFAQSQDGDAGIGYSRRLIVFGVRGHPTIDDLDIDEWDRFTMEEQEYTVLSVNRHLIGQVQAQVEAIG
jgi:hypothetical protein